MSCLAAVLPNLELLELAYCRCLTDNALRSITTLARLRYTGCRDLDSPPLQPPSRPPWGAL